MENAERQKAVCGNCNRSIDPDAKICPHCKKPLRHRQKELSRRSFTQKSIGTAIVLVAAVCAPTPRANASVDTDKLSAAIKRMRNAIKNIAEDVNKLYSRQSKVLVPDFPPDLTELRTAYGDLLVATGHEE